MITLVLMNHLFLTTFKRLAISPSAYLAELFPYFRLPWPKSSHNCCSRTLSVVFCELCLTQLSFSSLNKSESTYSSTLIIPFFGTSMVSYFLTPEYLFSLSLCVWEILVSTREIYGIFILMGDTSKELTTGVCILSFMGTSFTFLSF